jgi:hypothetical protein
MPSCEDKTAHQIFTNDAEPKPTRSPLPRSGSVQLFGGANGGGRCSFAHPGVSCPPPSLTSPFGHYTHHKAMNIPSSENALLIRTDFSDQSAWKKLKRAVSDPGDPFVFGMEIVDDRANSGATVEQLMEALPKDYPHSFMAVADRVAISQLDYPLLVVDLGEERGRQFRAVAAQVASIDNNLSIANMGFEEFADAVDDGGVFRGFPET